MNTKRIDELLEIALNKIEQNDWFDYNNWDDLIECEESITADELDWMEENFEIKVSIKLKDKTKVKFRTNNNGKLELLDDDGGIIGSQG